MVHRTSLKHRAIEELVSFSFLLPAAFLFFFFVVLPFIQGIPMSFFKWDGFSKEKTWIGMSNFIDLFSDKSLLSALLRTLQFTALSVIMSNAIGLAIALIIHRASRFHSILRTIFFMPFVTSLVLSAFIWAFLYNDVVYRYFNIPSPLGSTTWVIAGLSAISVWRDAGYCMVIYIAALLAVPSDFYEAAQIEGAGRLRTFFGITLPCIMSAVTANVTLLLAWGLKVFDYPMAATNGGPGQASETIALCVYNNIFHYYKAGYGQAAAFLFTFFVFILTSSVTRAMRNKEIEL
ncbi:MAG: sugar ABC transporter permease [Treponemataceae bacterium]